tara:strand:+ start:1704 stop:3248 length:1545 start_codon:yes stop_codon:yes gene_type:complete
MWLTILKILFGLFKGVLRWKKDKDFDERLRALETQFEERVDSTKGKKKGRSFTETLETTLSDIRKKKRQQYEALCLEGIRWIEIYPSRALDKFAQAKSIAPEECDSTFRRLVSMAEEEKKRREEKKNTKFAKSLQESSFWLIVRRGAVWGGAGGLLLALGYTFLLNNYPRLAVYVWLLLLGFGVCFGAVFGGRQGKGFGRGVMLSAGVGMLWAVMLPFVAQGVFVFHELNAGKTYRLVREVRHFSFLWAICCVFAGMFLWCLLLYTVQAASHGSWKGFVAGIWRGFFLSAMLSTLVLFFVHIVSDAVWEGLDPLFFTWLVAGICVGLGVGIVSGLLTMLLIHTSSLLYMSLFCGLGVFLYVYPPTFMPVENRVHRESRRKVKRFLMELQKKPMWKRRRRRRFLRRRYRRRSVPQPHRLYPPRSYRQVLHDRVRAVIHFPPTFKAKQIAMYKKKLRLDFFLDKKGIPKKLKITRSSGNKEFDTLIIKSILAGAPFPPPPASMWPKLQHGISLELR